MSLYDLQRAVVSAATDYALQLIAWHQDGDEQAKVHVRTALVPFEELRAGATRARRGPSGQGSDAETGTGPGPGLSGPPPMVPPTLEKAGSTTAMP